VHPDERTALVLSEIQAALSGRPLDVPRLAALADIPDDPDRPGASATLRGLVLLTGAYLDTPGYDATSALAEADRLIREAPPTGGFAVFLAALRHALLVKRSQERGEIGGAKDAADFARGVAEAGDLNPEQKLLMEALRTAGEAHHAVQRGDLDGAMRLAAGLDLVLDQLPADHVPGGQSRRRGSEHAAEERPVGEWPVARVQHDLLAGGHVPHGGAAGTHHLAVGGVRAEPGESALQRPAEQSLDRLAVERDLARALIGTAGRKRDVRHGPDRGGQVRLEPDASSSNRSVNGAGSAAGGQYRVADAPVCVPRWAPPE
jgi:hypothetical protein